MRATTQRGALLETLGKVKSAVAVKHTLPVLGAVLIRAYGGQLTLTGTNLEVALTASCKANVTRKGAIVVPPKMLEAFLKAVKAETVTLSMVNKDHLKVEAGATTTLEGFDPQEFPKVEGVRGKAVEVTGLAGALKQISYAMAREDSRPVLNGISFAPENGSVVLAAADGFRLAVTKVKAKGKFDQAIVPARAVQLVERLMPGKVSIHRAKDGKSTPHISFVGEGLVLTAMLTQGTYPGYEQIIPTGGSLLTVDKGALKNALDVVSVTLPSNDIVRFQTRGGNLVVSTMDVETGETEIKVPAKGKAQIAFNIRYMRDLLSKASDQFVLRLRDAQTPGVVKQNGTIHVVMPMHVQW